jgi:ribosome-binding factor A
MRARQGKGGGQRRLRVGEAYRHELAAMFQRGEVPDPALGALSITVTQVDVSPDLRNALAFVTPLGQVERAEFLAALKRVAPAIQGEIARRLGLRLTARLAFRFDDRFEKARRIEELLRDPVVAADIARRDG